MPVEACTFDGIESWHGLGDPSRMMLCMSLVEGRQELYAG